MADPRTSVDSAHIPALKKESRILINLALDYSKISKRPTKEKGSKKVKTKATPNNYE